MNKFTLMLDNTATAVQIAALLNKHNKLKTYHTYQSIINSPVEYFVKHGVFKDELRVVGCVGLQVTNNTFTLMKHLCVHELFRRSKIAEHLITVAMQSVKTQYIYMTVREDNIPCFTLACKLGFQIIQRETYDSHNVLTMGKQKV